jgi:RimJ/RimL family protein N-acetyltransferase
MRPDYPIETERLVLRPLEPDDFDALYAYQSREDVTRYLYWGPRTKPEVRGALEEKMAHTAIDEEGDFIVLAAVTKDTGVLVGDVNLLFVSEEHQQGEIGYIVHPDHQCHGYATEAAHVMLRLGFEDLALHRIVGRAEARNTGSARVLEKLGMRREAHLVENEFVRGEWQGELIYAMLDREWPSAPLP